MPASAGIIKRNNRLTAVRSDAPQIQPDHWVHPLLYNGSSPLWLHAAGKNSPAFTVTCNVYQGFDVYFSSLTTRILLRVPNWLSQARSLPGSRRQVPSTTNLY